MTDADEFEFYLNKFVSFLSMFEFQIKSSCAVMKPEDSLPDDELRLLSALIISSGQDQQKGFFSEILKNKKKWNLLIDCIDGKKRFL